MRIEKPYTYHHIAEEEGKKKRGNPICERGRPNNKSSTLWGEKLTYIGPGDCTHAKCKSGYSEDKRADNCIVQTTERTL